MNELIPLLPQLAEATGETLYIVALSLLFGGIGGLLIGLGLAVTRGGALYANRFVFGLLNVIVNVFRPIPFIIFITAVGPLTQLVMGTTIGTRSVLFPMSFMATFVIGRIVEQNLVSVDPGVVEAARAMGASRFRIVWSVLVPEALGPLILGYTFIFIAVVDMSAMAGYVGGGGLGDFAIVYGYRAFEWQVTVVATLIIIVLVQAAQFFGNWLSAKIMRR